MDEKTLNSVIDAMTEMRKMWAIVVLPTDKEEEGIEVRRVHLECEDSVQKLTTREKAIVRRENVPYFITLLLIQERVIESDVLARHILPIFQRDDFRRLRLVDRNLNPV